MSHRFALVLPVLAAIVWCAAFAQQTSPLPAGRWQYLQPPDTEGEVLDLFVSAGRWRGIMNGLERAGEHGLFYYVVEIENLVVESEGGVSFEVGERSFFHARPTLSQLGGDGDGGFTRGRMRFDGRLQDGDLILRCLDESGSCPDSTLRFERIDAAPESSQSAQPTIDGAAERQR